MAGDYQVTEAIHAEQEAVKRVTAELARMKKQKNSGLTAIRSWRFKYRNWKSRVTVYRQSDILGEDEAEVLRRLARNYNRLLEGLSSVRQISTDTEAKDLLAGTSRLGRRITAIRRRSGGTLFTGELATSERQLEQAQETVEEYQQRRKHLEEQEAHYEDYRASLSRYERQEARYEDYLQLLRQYTRQQARYEEYRRLHHQWESEYEAWQDRQAERKEAQEWAQDVADLVAEVNGNDLGVKLFELSPTTEVRVVASAPSNLARTIIRTIKEYQYGLQSVAGSDLWQTIQAPNLEGELDETSLQVQLGQELEAWAGSLRDEGYQAVLTEPEEPAPREPEPVRRPVEPEKVSEPVKPEEVKQPTGAEPVPVPAFTAVLDEKMIKAKPENGVEQSLVEEMDGYGTGPYTNTRGRESEINALAERIGQGCPKIAETSTKFDNSGLLSALGEVKSSWSLFGGQRNSSTGLAIVERFKTATNRLEDASSYTELADSEPEFSESSTQLFIWLSSKWWQNGGTPGGNAHAWHGEHVTKLVKPK